VTFTSNLKDLKR